MLLSMTGFGEGRSQATGLDVAAELRSVNNRHLKLSIRVPDGCGSWEPLLEDELRQRMRRGTVYLTVRVERRATADDYRINSVVLESYRSQLAALGDSPPLTALLGLPGVVETSAAAAVDAEMAWPLVLSAVAESSRQLESMRQREGVSMQRELLSHLERLAEELAQVRMRSPLIVTAYQERLAEKIRLALVDHTTDVSPQDLLREVSLFADRVDVAEEMVRLDSHLEQARQIMDQRESAGRKLDFLIQEMFRETNTIGSKANDAEVARRVVEMKTVLERMREIIQNVE